MDDLRVYMVARMHNLHCRMLSMLWTMLCVYSRMHYLLVRVLHVVVLEMVG